MLIIRIDGGTWKILNEAIDLAQMPYLKNLKENGAYGTLLSTIPPISPKANKKIVKNLFTKKEIYKGEKLHLIQDLSLQPEKGYSFVGLFKGKKQFLEEINI